MRYPSLWGLAILVVVSASWDFLQEAEEPRSRSDPPADLSKLVVEDGDVVFRRGRSLNSRAVLLADQDSRFSHVGVVIGSATSEASVVHAVPSTEDDLGGVRIEPLAEFLSEKKAVTWGVYRLAREDRLAFSKEAAKYAEKAGREGVEFDSAFELVDDSKLYCTELVWRAYRAAGLDIIDGRFDEIQLPILKADLAILPSRLENSHHLQQVLFPQDLGENE